LSQLRCHSVAPLNYPPYFEEDFEDVSVEAGETLLYYFPGLHDINTDDILTPTLSIFLGKIPDFFIYNDDLKYMKISPLLD